MRDDRNEKENPAELTLPLLPTKTSSSIKPKVVVISIVSIINGALYFVVAIEGGKNIQTLFNASGNTADAITFGVGVGASLVYCMFTYKTLESLSLKINSVSQGIFAFLAPFSAAAFLTAGKSGSELL